MTADVEALSVRTDAEDDLVTCELQPKYVMCGEKIIPWT